MATEIETNKKSSKKVHIKRVEIEYKDMNYIIANLEENVIDVNGELWEYSRINFPENLKIDTISVSGLDRNPQISKAIKWPKNCQVKKLEKIK